MRPARTALLRVPGRWLLRIACLALVAAVAAPAAAQYLPAPDSLPDGLEGPCRETLETRLRDLQDEWAFLESQIAFHEGMCGAVDPQDTAQMNECAASEADIGPQIDAYFDLLGPYLIDVGAVRTRLEDLLPTLGRLENALDQKRVALTELDARFAFHGEEINRALLRLTGGNDRIAEWQAMTQEAQKKALQEAFFLVADYVLGTMKIENSQASEAVRRRLEDVDSLLREYGAYPMLVQDQARLSQTLAGITRNHDVLAYTKLAKNAVKLWKIEDIPYEGVKKVTLALMDVLRMVSPFKWQLIIGGSKFGAAYLYAVYATIKAEQNVDLESEHMAVHLRAIDANQTRRESIMAERRAVLSEIDALERERAALAIGCPASN